MSEDLRHKRGLDFYTSRTDEEGRQDDAVRLLMRESRWPMVEICAPLGTGAESEIEANTWGRDNE